jgi:hypothetical protein
MLIKMYTILLYNRTGHLRPISKVMMNSMKQRPSVDTSSHIVRKFSDCHGNRRVVTACADPPLVHVLLQMNPVCPPKSLFFQIHFNIILSYYPPSPKWSLPFMFSD